jgi:hypothetical protein
MRFSRRKRTEGAVHGAIGSLVAVSLDAPSPTPLRDLLAAFSRPRTPEDELPAWLVRKLQAWDAEGASEEPDEVGEAEPRGLGRLPLVGRAFHRELDPEITAELEALNRKTAEDLGSHIADESRLLLRDLGARLGRLYAVPTTTGRVGVYFVAGELGEMSGWVAGELLDGIRWHISYGREPSGPMHFSLFGLAADDATALEVELDGKTESVRLANNGFYYESEDREPSGVAAIVLHERGGGRHGISVRV